MKTLFWRLIPLMLFMSLAIFFWRGLALDPKSIPSTFIGKPLPKFKLPILGEAKGLLTPSDLLGHYSLLNVWASWCQACTEEQPFLLALAKQGVPIYGISYKDNSQNAEQWLAEWGNPYRLIGQDTQGKVGIDLGVYGAPETFLVDEKGVIQYRHVGVLDKDSWRKDFLPKIKKLGGLI